RGCRASRPDLRSGRDQRHRTGRRATNHEPAPARAGDRSPALGHRSSGRGVLNRLMSPPSRPKLSVVVTTRNDNHGGDLNTRTQLFLDGLAAQANRHRIHTELVLVEWNPPADRAPIEEALRWPEPSEYFEVRIVIVPHELHAQLENADRLF